MFSGQHPDQETISALLARLVEDGRALVKAELALFRTDFYRRLARARTGALLLLVGAIMGQAAAVTFLVTLSFVLTPWIGRLGGAAVSVLLGLGLAVLLIRIGIRRLIMVVEDYEDLDDGGEPPPTALDVLFERMRQRSQEARDHLKDTVEETQARLHPQMLIADLADHLVDQAQAISHAAIDALRRRPVRNAAAGIALFLVLFRTPIFRILGGLGLATRTGAGSFTTRQGTTPTPDQDEESRS